MKTENEHRIAREAAIARKVVELLLHAGYLVGVNDGEEITVKPCGQSEKIVAALCTTDEDWILTRLGNKSGWVRLIYGNDTDLISDYTMDLDPIMKIAYNWIDDKASFK